MSSTARPIDDYLPPQKKSRKARRIARKKAKTESFNSQPPTWIELPDGRRRPATLEDL